MRLAFLALLLCALAAAPVHASGCMWSVMPNISPPDEKNDLDSGSSWNATWAWQYVVRADHYSIVGQMSAYVYRCTTNLAVAATGNATFTVSRIMACRYPVEDIEADGRNEFTARAEINDDSYARARGSERIHAPKMGFDCHAVGGVEATAAGLGDGTSGTVTIPLYPGGPTMVIYWSKGGAIEQAFQGSDSGAGGSTPETFICQTSIDLAVSVGWWEDSGLAKVSNPKSELHVYGTCDGYCGACDLVINDSAGY
jgi:hypothetical protein